MSERKCKYPGCWYHTKDATGYCTTSCSCDHADYLKLTTNEKQDVLKITKIGKRPWVRRPL